MTGFFNRLDDNDKKGQRWPDEKLKMQDDRIAIEWMTMAK
jgi:hypothetical protein